SLPSSIRGPEGIPGASGLREARSAQRLRRREGESEAAARAHSRAPGSAAATVVEEEEELSGAERARK
ncbi:Hypothetical predicted protein, partial [Marmota monax]